MQPFIRITGASENNLKRVSLDIPHGKLVVFTGVSGSGKSSLVFDTIAAEAGRQLGELLPSYVRSRLPHYAAPHAARIDGLTPAVVVGQRPFTGDVRSTVGTMVGVSPMLRLLFSRGASPRVGNSTAYSFNDPAGMCPACSGLGYTVAFDLEKLLDRDKSLNEGALLFPGHQVGAYQWQMYAHSGFFDPDKPLRDFTEEEWRDLLHGSGRVVEIKNRTGKVWGNYTLTYEGFLDRITRLYLKRDVSALHKAGQRIVRDFTCERACPACRGARLNVRALESRLCGYNIAEMGDLEISALIPVLEKIADPVGAPTARRIAGMLDSLVDMGLGYLTLNRPSRTLSGGEGQRLKMVRYLGTSLTGLTYIFDEPTGGMHPGDAARLMRLLLRLRDRGNTVLVVEHNPAVIRLADQVIDMGPAAGRQGGEIVFQGTPAALLAADTQTARFLQAPLPPARPPRPGNGFLTIAHARQNNLKDITVRIPKNALTVVSGPAGAGKTSLVCGELLRQYPDAVYVSQAPIGTSIRSNPATYLGIMNEIRRLLARENGVEAALFSANSKGACPVCAGRGVVTTEMAFLDPVTQPCEACGGTRFGPQALRYRYRGKNIAEILQMTMEEAAVFFDRPALLKKVRLLCDTGMGYMTLGQPTSTLSGGECQRIKLAGYQKGRSGLYLLDEPAAGLHGADVRRLLRLMQDLVDRGNTVVAVEHNLSVIWQADFVLDMGPGGGREGGEVLFSGTPRALLACPYSATAACLRQEKNPEKKI